MINSNSHIIKIEPSILIWARETIGLSVEDVAKKIGKSIEDVKNWENGLEFPTYAQLEKLAYNIYKRPLAVFFLPNPPKESTPKQDFRSIPENELDELTPDIRLAIRKAKYNQLILRNINDNINPVSNPIFKNFKITSSYNITKTCDTICNLLNINLELRISFKNPEHAFSVYREIIEKNGIFIFQYPIKGIRGFSLMDNEFPLIVLNSSDSANSKNFTIFHELSHILLNTNGILTDFYKNYLTEQQNKIEIFCNKFASEMVLPNANLLTDKMIINNKNNSKWSDDILLLLSKKFVVSTEVILRKLLENGLTTNDFYELKRKQWNDLYKKHKEEIKKQKGGPSFHVTNLSHLGKNFVIQVLDNFYKGSINSSDVSNFLGIKISRIKEYEQKVYR